MNAIRGKLNDHAAKGYSQINAYEYNLQQIYLRARNRIEMQLSNFLQRRNASFTGPRLIGLFDDLNEMFPQFEEEYRETYEHALEYMAHQNYAAALQDMGLKENVVGTMDKSLFENMKQDGFQHIAGATKQMQTEVISELRKMSARVMREATLTGMTRAEVSRHLAAELLYAPDAKLKDFQFIDAGGRHWKTEKYFKMLGRTLLHNNARECYLAGCAKAGSDIVTISVSGDCCDACGKYENALLSISGATPGLPTLEEAMAEGLFHPNCTHRIIAVPESIARKYYGMGGSEKPKAKETPAEKPTSQTGQTKPEKKAKSQETHEQHLARRQQQWNDAYDKRRDQWYQSIIKAGGSKEIAAELADIYTPEMAQLGYPPEIVFSKNQMANYDHRYGNEKFDPKKKPNNRGGKIVLHPDIKEWSGHPLTAVHEMGHWVDFHIRFKNLELGKPLKTAKDAGKNFVEAGKKDWDLLKQRKPGFLNYYKKELYYDLTTGKMEGEYWLHLQSKLFPGKSSLSLSEQKILSQYMDTVGSITNGRFGGGHSKDDYKKQYGFDEAFAQTFSAYKRNDAIFKLEFPNMWRYIEETMEGLDILAKMKGLKNV